MGKCKVCGADIPDGQELCENCRNDLDTVNEEDLNLDDMGDFDFSEIELPELSGDVYETDLEFQLDDPNNNLENPDIFVHDFETEEPQLSEEEEQRIEKDIANMELPDDISEDEIPTLDDMTKADENVNPVSASEDLHNLPDTGEEGLDEIPDISDILGAATENDSEGSHSVENDQDVNDSLGLDEDIMNILSGTDGASEEDEPLETPTEENDLNILDLLPDDNKESQEPESQNDGGDISFVDDLLGGLSFDSPDTEDSDMEDNEERDKRRDIFSELDDGLGLMDDLPDADAIASEAVKKPKISFWKRLFGNIKDDKWEKQKAKEEKEEAEKLAKKEAEKEKAAKAAEAEAESGEGEEKTDPKEAKKAEKQAKKEEKARKKQEKKAEKQKMKELAELEDADPGRINRVGAAIVFIFWGIVATFIIIGTSRFSYNSSISRATEYFDDDEYNDAYEALWGLEIKEKDEELYSKVQMVMYLNKEWNSYENYTNIRMYPEALDSLLKGIEKYDAHIDDAKELEVGADYKKIRNNILKQLKDEYGLTEKEAYKLLAIKNQEDYSQKVIKQAEES